MSILHNVYHITTDTPLHDDVINWKHFPRYWPFVRGIHRSPVNSPHKASDAELWCLLWLAPEYGWVNSREADDLRRHRAHYDVIVMGLLYFVIRFILFMLIVYTHFLNVISRTLVQSLDCLSAREVSLKDMGKNNRIHLRTYLWEHDVVIQWNHFPRCRPFVTQNFIFVFICAWASGWAINLGACDFRRHRIHHDVTVMKSSSTTCASICCEYSDGENTC